MTFRSARGDTLTKNTRCRRKKLKIYLLKPAILSCWSQYPLYPSEWSWNNFKIDNCWYSYGLLYIYRTEEAHIRCLGIGADIAIPAGDDKAGESANIFIYTVRKYLELNYRVGRVLFLQSSELGLPHPLARRRVCLPPLVRGGGTHSQAREGVGETQFRWGDIHCGTQYKYKYFVILTQKLLVFYIELCIFMLKTDTTRSICKISSSIEILI